MLSKLSTWSIKDKLKFRKIKYLEKKIEKKNQEKNNKPTKENYQEKQNYWSVSDADVDGFISAYIEWVLLVCKHK